MWGQLLMYEMFTKAQTQGPGEKVDRCRYLIAEYVLLTRVCSTDVDEEMFLTTQSLLYEVGEPVTIFIDESHTVMFVTMKESKLHKCLQLRILQYNEFYCFKAIEESKILLNDSKMYCFPYHLYLADLALKTCDILEMEETKLAVQNTIRGAIHFTFGESKAVTLLLQDIWIVVIVISVLLLN